MSVLMSVLAAVAVPHPPLIFPEVGQGQEQKIEATIDAYRQAMRFVAEYKPDTVIVVSPHTTVYTDYFHISPGAKAEGDFTAFRAPDVKLTVSYDTEFVQELENMCKSQGFPCGTAGEKLPQLDHATLIPLRFLNEVWPNYKVVRIGQSGLSNAMHYRLGQMINTVVGKLGRRAVFIASGDLSHKLLPEGPYGFAAEGPEFDKRITADLAKGDFMDILNFDPQFCNKAAECGYRSFVMMAGALDGKAVKSQLLSYEGPYGVGYGVATFAVTGNDITRRFGEKYAAQNAEALAARKHEEDPYVRLARLTVETYVRKGMLAMFPDDLPTEMLTKRAGVFVTLKEHGELRGCIGTIAPVQHDIALEILQNGISACSKDPRFTPVRPDELDDIVYSVDVLLPPENIDSIDALDAKTYGVIVTNGDRRGLLLPDIEGVDTPAQQIAIAKQKAGIEPHEPVALQRFKVERHH